MSSISHRTPRHVSNPRRLLILSPTSHAQATVPALLHSLTGLPVSAPPQTTPTGNKLPAAREEVQVGAEAEITTVSFAGYTTHAPFRVETKYYTVDVPIWLMKSLFRSVKDPSNRPPELRPPLPQPNGRQSF
ncbi:hypothetical protein V8E54_011900 [Elaphomyces granulatus]